MTAIRIKFSFAFKTSILILMMVVNQFANEAYSQQEQTYAERSGWKKGDRVIMFHVDDAGMSHESNQGAIQALENGVATSLSVMMPCPWVPDMIQYLVRHPQSDAGLHLTHTAEWIGYRWSSLTGISSSPGLSDNEGALWNNVADVVKHATPDEIEAEIKAQLSRARKMGFNPTHMDTHMGTLWSTPEYLDRYIKIGIEEHIPILFSAGHNTLMRQSLQGGPLAPLVNLAGKVNSEMDIPAVLKAIGKKGEEIWNAGLPVVDDLYILSYDWMTPSGKTISDEDLRKFKTQKYKELLRSVKPGITIILIHCTNAGDGFKHISNSGDTRKADLLSMTDPELKKFIKEQGFILTTWKELQQRRDKQRD